MFGITSFTLTIQNMSKAQQQRDLLFYVIITCTIVILVLVISNL